MQAFNIYHNVFIQADSADLFKAISEPKYLVNWWPLRCSGKCELNEEYNLFFTEEYDWLAKIEELRIDHFIQFKMIKSDPDWDSTFFRFELIVQENGTLLEFSHCNWPKNNHHFRRSSYCWAILLKGLKDYLEQGSIVPFEKRG